jgi:sRNA-binding carbon storage regulator CsrA
MLILTRKPGQILRIMPHEEAGPLTVAELFAEEPMEIVVGKVDGKQVRIGVRAHRGLLIVRGELEGTEIAEGFRRKGW